MTIEAQLPDGTTLQFPDGTPDAVVTGAVKQHLSANPISAPQTPEAKLGLTPAPPEKPKPAPIEDPSGGSEFGEGGAYSWTPTSSPPGAGSMGLDTSTEPRPGVAQLAPLSRDPKTGQLNLAIPGAIRGIYSEFPQIKNWELTVPGATLNPQTGTYGATPEALSAASLATPQLRFGGRPPLPPWMPEARLGPGAAAGGPAFLPPGTLQSVQLNQLLEAIGAVDQRAANKPAFIPPTTSTDVAGNVTPIQQPRIPASPPEPPPTSPTPPQAPAPTAPTAPPTPPISSSAIPLSADQILAHSKAWFNPADQQAAAGATVNAGPSNGIRGVLVDTVPTDPQTAIAKGQTPLTQLGKEYAAFQDQPMSFEAMMQLDRRLTAEKRAAMRNDPSMANEIGQAQDRIRDKMQSLSDTDTTGDPSALAGLQKARQAYAQYIKETQLDDIRYGASLLPAEKQDAYVQSRTRALLKGDQSRNWTPDERAAAEAAITQGVRGFIGNAAISIIKPAATTLGFKMAGPAGAWVGSTVGEAGQAMVRDALARRRPDRLGPVSGVITQSVPLAPRNTLLQ